MMCSLKNKKVLITCGPTWVPIDDMRIIGNSSTGEMGHLIAKQILKAGAKVTILEGPVQNRLDTKGIKIINFVFYSEFAKLLKLELKNNYDILIHAAAVSDYTLASAIKSKIKSGLKKLRLDLVPTKKLIPIAKKICPKIVLVGFKLESKTTKKSSIDSTKELFKEAKCDFVITNTSNKNKYNGYILNKDLVFLAEAKSKEEMAKKLIKIL